MILILTPYSFNPLHPRLEYVEKVFLENGYSVKKYNLKSNSRVLNKLNWLSLTFFQVPSFFKSFKYIWKYRQEAELIYIQDLQYLPISMVAKLFGKKVIYDTLDNNVELNFYHLSNRFKIFKKLSFIKNITTFLEKKLSRYFCDKTIVNSKALVDYFKPNSVELIYYTSPFEKKFQLNINNDIAFLYLGSFEKMKGADIILDFIEKYNRRIFIFGTLNSNEKNLKDKINSLSKIGLVTFVERLSSNLLEVKLKELFLNHRLIGFSLTQNVNKSNETQEINKDIDYLAMGIPLIANHRKPTKEKIDLGCGVLIENESNIEKILEDKMFYQDISNNCTRYYNEFYAQNIFEKKLLKVIENES